jgi:stearoyl-CoA desaturase (delta-9 desaturase)
MKLKERWGRRTGDAETAINWAKGNWGTATFLICAHLGSIAALFFWSWPAVITGVVLYWVGGSLGIGMGYHRLITHRGYKVPKAG